MRSGGRILPMLSLATLLGCEGELRVRTQSQRTPDASPSNDAAVPLDARDRDAGSRDPAVDAGRSPDAPFVSADAARTLDALPAPTLGCEGRIVCEDFEDEALGGAPGAPWEVSLERATMEVSSGRAVSGSRALQIQIEGGEGNYRRAYLSVSGAPFFPLVRNEMWGRMMLFAESLPGAGQHVHWTNISAEGPIPGRDGVTSLYRYGGMNDDRWLANFETYGAATDC